MPNEDDAEIAQLEGVSFETGPDSSTKRLVGGVWIGIASIVVLVTVVVALLGSQRDDRQTASTIAASRIAPTR